MLPFLGGCKVSLVSLLFDHPTDPTIPLAILFSSLFSCFLSFWLFFMFGSFAWLCYYLLGPFILNSSFMSWLTKISPIFSSSWFWVPFLFILGEMYMTLFMAGDICTAGNG